MLLAGGVTGLGLKLPEMFGSVAVMLNVTGALYPSNELTETPNVTVLPGPVVRETGLIEIIKSGPVRSNSIMVDRTSPKELVPWMVNTCFPLAALRVVVK